MKVLYCFICTFLIFISVHGQTDSKTLRIAVINLSPDNQELSKFGDLVQVELMKKGNIELLEREQINALLREQKIELDGRGGILKAGNILRADLIIFFQEEKPFARIMIFDIKHGLRVFDDKTSYDMKSVLKSVKRSLSICKEKNPKIFSVPPFISNELQFKFDQYQDVFAKAMREELLSRKIFVVEFEEAREIFNELQTSQGEKRINLPELSVIIGKFTKNKNKENVFDLELLETNTNGLTKKYTGSAPIDNRKLKIDIKKLCDEILKGKGTVIPSIVQNIKEQIGRAKQNIERGSFEQARQELEAAMLINDSFEIRGLLIKAYEGILEHMNKNASMDEKLFLYLKIIEHLEYLVKNKYNFNYDEALNYISFPLTVTRRCGFSPGRDAYLKALYICEDIIINYDLKNGSEALKRARDTYLEIMEFLYPDDKKRAQEINKFMLRVGDPLLDKDGLLIDEKSDTTRRCQLIEFLKLSNIPPKLKNAAEKQIKFWDDLVLERKKLYEKEKQNKRTITKQDLLDFPSYMKVSEIPLTLTVKSSYRIVKSNSFTARMPFMNRLLKVVDCGEAGEAFYFNENIVFAYSKTKMRDVVKNETEQIEYISDVVWSGKRLWIAIINVNSQNKEKPVSRGEIVCWDPETGKSVKWGEKEGILLDFIEERPLYRSNSKLELIPFKDGIFIIGAQSKDSFAGRVWLGQISSCQDKNVNVFFKAEKSEETGNAKDSTNLSCGFWPRIFLFPKLSERSEDQKIIIYRGELVLPLELNPYTRTVSAAKTKLTYRGGTVIAMGDEWWNIDNVLYLPMFRPSLHIMDKKNENINRVVELPSSRISPSYEVKGKLFKYKGYFFVDQKTLVFADIEKNIALNVTSGKEQYKTQIHDMYGSKFFGILGMNIKTGQCYQIDVDIEGLLKANNK